MLAEIGADNMFIFGHTVEGVRQLQSGGYRPHEWYDGNPRIRRIIDAIAQNRFSPDEPGIFEPILDSLLRWGDRYLNLADLPAYLETQERVATCYRDPESWSSKAILNVARTGRFSSDRTIREYASDIGGIQARPWRRKKSYG